MANYKFTPVTRRYKPIPVGSEFGLLTVTGEAVLDNRQWRVPCRCECGAETKPYSWDIKNGHTQSCGRCCRSMVPQARAKIGRANRRHGMHGTPEYNAWLAMRKRCHNPEDAAFRNYGARGIFVCEEWRNDFAAFLAHVGPKPDPALSIDRIDNSRGYEPGNVRWADASTQNRNRRPFMIIPGSRSK